MGDDTFVVRVSGGTGRGTGFGPPMVYWIIMKKEVLEKDGGNTQLMKSFS